jgi:hypothetical protein
MLVLLVVIKPLQPVQFCRTTADITELYSVECKIGKYFNFALVRHLIASFSFALPRFALVALLS